jgi:hypothetical protein
MTLAQHHKGMKIPSSPPAATAIFKGESSVKNACFDHGFHTNRRRPFNTTMMVLPS